MPAAESQQALEPPPAIEAGSHIGAMHQPLCLSLKGAANKKHRRGCGNRARCFAP